MLLGDSLNQPLWGIGLLALGAALAERQSVRVSANAEMSVSLLPMLLAAVIYGPLAGLIVGAVGLLGDLRAPYIRWTLWTLQRALAGGASGLVALILLEGSSFGRLVAAVSAAVVTEALIDACLGPVPVLIRRTASYRACLTALKPILLATVPLYTPLLVLLAYIYVEISVWGVFLFLVPAFAAQSLYGLYRQQREATDKLTDANTRLERANLSFAGALVAALDARDRYTAGHSAAVAIYARDIAARLGLSKEGQDLVHLCGLLHDIGKVGLAPGILEKAGPLTTDEREQMQQHSAIGERILANVEDYAEIATIVRHHHEQPDGNGYPDGLRDSEIPLMSRIIGVADAYNAMTSGRPYRSAMSSATARSRLAIGAGCQFDADIVRAFEWILAHEGETYLSGLRADFAVEAQAHRQLDPVPAPVAA